MQNPKSSTISTDGARRWRAWMRVSTLFALCGALAFGAFGGGCGGRTVHNPILGGESHFLQRCSSSCGSGLDCIAGVCTRGCLVGGANACADLTRAVCTAGSIEPGQVAVCDVECRADRDCRGLGESHRCAAGYCRAPAREQNLGGTGGSVGNGGAGAGGADPVSGAGGNSSNGGNGSTGSGGLAAVEFWRGGAVPAECALPTRDERLDFIVMQFVNRTSTPLYLASQNPDCGVWPAFVEFRRGNDVVDIYDGDCATSCWDITTSGYRTAGSPGECVNAECLTPLKLLDPGDKIAQFVYPWVGVLHEVPGSCFPDEERSSVSCMTTHDLPADTYSVVARAYTALSCGGAVCECGLGDAGATCATPEGGRAPQGAGQLREASATLVIGDQVLGASATFEFTE